MEILRIVVTGPVGAGKSTFIRSISEIEVVDTDERATDETAQLKRKTTVAFDFGRLSFGPEMALHVYGTPGQTRFDFMWDILIRRAHAYVLLVAAHRPAEFRAARSILNFMSQRASIPLVIGMTHMDCEGAWSAEDLTLALGYGSDYPPIIPVDANNSSSVSEALVTLLQHMMSVQVRA
ncbi:ATP/GTP-binding protein [Leptolyngbya sp. FACHB-261]|uniref:GTP-binding protein n=1 Tax=Leptolyngbya sp. FACHB-261 TaxID=2692806 RepID=UPI001686BB5B|nr:ATP/GTP-binding protein [Leptolyngbya sp. FACHB-261]MBD2102987.1 ATP/GTP-binding protein [Leptolyngbya sp. FACHB-261]